MSCSLEVPDANTPPGYRDAANQMVATTNQLRNLTMNRFEMARWVLIQRNLRRKEFFDFLLASAPP
jgi:hypothetical protein